MPKCAECDFVHPKNFFLDGGDVCRYCTSITCEQCGETKFNTIKNFSNGDTICHQCAGTCECTVCHEVLEVSKFKKGGRQCLLCVAQYAKEKKRLKIDQMLLTQKEAAISEERAMRHPLIFKVLKNSIESSKEIQDELEEVKEMYIALTEETNGYIDQINILNEENARLVNNIEDQNTYITQINTLNEENFYLKQDIEEKNKLIEQYEKEILTLKRNSKKVSKK